MVKKVHNIKDLKERRRNLRNNLTTAEATLWKYLKKRGLEGRKFRRQHSVGKYILDFYCPEEKLCIELDGKRHFKSFGREYDAKRTAYLEKYGIRVCRIENKRVFIGIEGVLQEIKSYLLPPPPTPPQRGWES